MPTRPRQHSLDAASRVSEPRSTRPARLRTAPHHHYVARTIDPPQQKVLPPDIRFLQARGPFDKADEIRLLEDEKIDIVVSKNSGGAATYAKIEAARDLGLPSS